MYCYMEPVWQEIYPVLKHQKFSVIKIRNVYYIQNISNIYNVVIIFTIIYNKQCNNDTWHIIPLCVILNH